MVQRHVVLGTDVLAAAEEVGDGRLAVLVERAAQGPAAAADMQHERHAGFFELRPDRPVVGMRRRLVPRRRRRHEDRAAAHLHRLRGRAACEFGIGERHVPDGDQPRVVVAEVDHRAVVRAGPAVQQLDVVARELHRRERAEHELRVEAEEVERAAAFAGIERAECAPTFRAHQVVFERGRRGRIAAARFGAAHCFFGEGTRPAEIQRPQPLAHGGVGVLHQPVVQFHQVTVGVVVRAALGVHHAAIESG